MKTGKRRSLRAIVIAAAILVAAATTATLPRIEAQATLQPPVHVSGTYDGQDNTRFQGGRLQAGQYLSQPNFWNKAVAGAFIPGSQVGTPACSAGGFDFATDPDSPQFVVSNNTANSYYPGGGDPSCGAPYSAPGAPGGPGVHLTCKQAAPQSDPGDPNCLWAGYGDPWINPKTGAEDEYAVTRTRAPWLPALPDSNPGLHTTGLNSEFSNQIHAPASYPDIYLGCHYTGCTPNNGAPFPIQLSALASMPVVWDMDTSQARGAGAAWDAALDIWLDTNIRYGSATLPAHPLPGNPKGIDASFGQNDGAEVMVWANHNNYGPDSGGAITPTGTRLMRSIQLPGVPGHWDVWAGRARNFDTGLRWNVISFVNVDRTDAFNTTAAGNRGPVVNGVQQGGVDVKVFLDFAESLGQQCTTAITPAQFQETMGCVDPGWWLTSVQAGFEIWNLPSTGSLRTTAFSVSPLGFSNALNNIQSRAESGTYVDGNGATGTYLVHRPVLNSDDSYRINTTACRNGTATGTEVSVPGIGGFGSQPAEITRGSGTFRSTSTYFFRGVPFKPQTFGPATTQVTINCPGAPRWITNGVAFVRDRPTADLLWYAPSSGQVSEWLTDFQGRVTFGPILDQTCATPCALGQPVAVADLNDDGHGDVFWFNSSNGLMTEWLLDGSGHVVGTKTVTRNCPQGCSTNWANWRFVGLGDFNTDGHVDVLFHAPGVGSLSVWTLDGLAGMLLLPRSWLGPACGTSDGCSAAWTATTTGDWNHDGKIDVLWSDRPDNQFGTWLLDGYFDLSGGGPFTPDTVYGPDWNIVGGGDLSLDGLADIWWYSPSDGHVDVWTMDGSGAPSGTRRLDQTCANGCGLDWRPVAVGDLNEH